MANPKRHSPVLLVSAVFSHQPQWLEWASQRLIDHFGPIGERTADLPFQQTRYYARSMGEPLIKRWVAFERLIDPAQLPEIKCRTIDWEQELADNVVGPPPRPVNIDPGYVTEAKLVLATAKDRDHRLYLGQGIFGEITLYYQDFAWQASRWTYPDYRSEEVLEFVERCRRYLRRQYGKA